MNQIKAVITQIDTVDTLNIVKFNFQGNALTMMSLDLNEEVSVGKEVILGIKPTHIDIGKGPIGLVSYTNQIKATIISCKNGKLLSSIKFSVNDIVLESIITLESTLRMDLKIDDDVIMMLKASELSILKVL